MHLGLDNKAKSWPLLIMKMKDKLIPVCGNDFGIMEYFWGLAMRQRGVQKHYSELKCWENCHKKVQIPPE